jgi:transcriptional regulator with XRE-family HTH domain
MMITAAQPVGDLLREWRQRRRMSQLDLALEADISTRHLSFVETGRAQPSRDMVLNLAEQLAVPLRERNVLLVAAGFAPVFPERPLQDPAMQAARKAVDLVLAGHEPYPALAVDRHWTLVVANKPVSLLLAGVDAKLLQQPVNVLRLSLHPDGLASRIANFREWRAHILARLHRQIDNSADAILLKLIEELKAYPTPPGSKPPRPQVGFAGIAVPLELVTDHGTLSFLSTTTVFGTPVDISLSELAIESFFPADQTTKEAMRRLSELDGK